MEATEIKDEFLVTMVKVVIEYQPQNWPHHQSQSFAAWQVHVQDDLASLDNRRVLPAIDI